MTTPSSRIRVMVVDDHNMVRRGLATFLKVFDDLELAGEAASGQAAIQLCALHPPDVVLMDMVMPDMDGATATRLIRKQSSSMCARKGCQIARGKRERACNKDCHLPLNQAARALAVKIAPSRFH